MLHNLSTTFILWTFGWPNLKCQLPKQIALVKAMFTWDTVGHILSTKVVEFDEQALHTGFELP